MKFLIRLCVLLLIVVPSLNAAELEIKVNQTAIKLPYWPALEPHNGGVLIIRGGEPVQWSEFLAGLSQQLADDGWSTLLLNCNADSSIPWITLLPEAMSALRQQKNNRIILIHYGEQLNLTLDYFSKPQGKAINGLILLSAYDQQHSLDKAPEFRFPVLDIVGQFDYDLVLEQAQLRKQFKSPTYMPLQIPGAPHDYGYTQQLLLSFLDGWMLKLPGDTPAASPIPKPRASLESYIVPVHPYLAAQQFKPTPLSDKSTHKPS